MDAIVTEQYRSKHLNTIIVNHESYIDQAGSKAFENVLYLNDKEKSNTEVKYSWSQTHNRSSDTLFI